VTNDREITIPPVRPIGLYKPPPPLLRTPDGIPEGWAIHIDPDNVPVLSRIKDPA
jgi:hypothetical protein